MEIPKVTRYDPERDYHKICKQCGDKLGEHPNYAYCPPSQEEIQKSLSEGVRIMHANAAYWAKKNKKLKLNLDLILR